MNETLLAWAPLVLGTLALVLLLALLWRRPDPGPIERLERDLRDELGRQSQATRADLATFQQMLLAQSGDVARTQNEQIDSFRVQLAASQSASAEQAHAQQAALAQQAQSLQTTLTQLAQQARDAQDAALRRMAEQVELRLAALQQGNEARLEQMRATVDEKLHATLEQRLGESFKQVAERLEQVHRGLGEMQSLARDVGGARGGGQGDRGAAEAEIGRASCRERV